MKTDRLNIRLYRADEKDHAVNLFTDAEVMRHVDMGVISTEAAEALWKKLIEDFYPNGKTTIYGIFAKTDESYVGHCSIRPRPSKTEDWEIGYILRKEAWGKGFATEIATRLIRFGFEELNLSQVFATIDEENLNSVKVAEKAGMQFARYEYDDEGRFLVYSIENKNKSKK